MSNQSPPAVEREDDVEEEEEEEDSEQMIRELGHHQMMERVQNALTKRLTNEDYRVSLEVKEMEEESRRFRVKRENLGVELYGVQQQLAKLQIALENSHNNYSAVSALRIKAASDVAKVKEIHKQAKAINDAQSLKVSNNQAELDALNSTLRQVEQYNEEMKSEIAVIRRATYKAEEAVEDKEKSKKQQDIYIDMLNDQLKNLQETLALYEAQLISQNKETFAAKDTLLEANKEMEAIRFEKKQLMQQWKSSLLGMQRRDEALQATQEALRKQKEITVSLNSEIIGYKKSILEQQKKSELLTARMEKVVNEEKYLTEEIKKLHEERSKYQERYTILRKSLENTDAEAEKLNLEMKNIEENIATLEKNLQTVFRSRQKLENEVANTRSAEFTVTKASGNLAKENQAVIQKVHEVEVSASAMENELARIKVDGLNTSAHNTQLQDTLTTINDELKEKDKLIEKYELEIRQRNDEIEKEMYVVDRLNRKYEQLTANMEDENMGPLEATIKNLSKAIEKNLTECEDIQRNWLRHQTELVNISSQNEGISSVVHELRSRKAILDQKSLRIDSQIASSLVEISSLKKGVTTMHTDMTRLNQLIAKNTDLQEKLANSNFNIENEFLRELKEMERDSVLMDAKLKSCKEEKARLLEEIVEIERQVMLWEKKITLEKETQTALDPALGHSEARGMEREIHRMQLRYETLQRDQKTMIEEMERCIAKREAIGIKHKGSKKKGEVSHASLKKKLLTSKETYASVSAEVKSFEGALRQKMEEMEELGTKLEELSKEYSEDEETANELQNTISKTLYEKQNAMDIVNKYNRIVKKYEDVQEGRVEPIKASDAESIERETQRQDEIMRHLHEIIRRMGVDYPQLKEVLERVDNLASF